MTDTCNVDACVKPNEDCVKLAEPTDKEKIMYLEDELKGVQKACCRYSKYSDVLQELFVDRMIDLRQAENSERRALDEENRINKKLWKVQELLFDGNKPRIRMSKELEKELKLILFHF